MPDPRDRATRKPGRQRANELPPVPKAPDFDLETPKFCLRHLVNNYDVKSLTQEAQAAFAIALQDRARMTWQEIKFAPRHALGLERIPSKQIKRQIPDDFKGDTSFMVLRYHENLPMVGTRVRDVFQIIWIEAQYGDVYNHG